MSRRVRECVVAMGLALIGAVIVTQCALEQDATQARGFVDMTMPAPTRVECE